MCLFSYSTPTPKKTKKGGGGPMEYRKEGELCCEFKFVTSIPAFSSSIFQVLIVPVSPFVKQL
jgi:hypothetical protein